MHKPIVFLGTNTNLLMFTETAERAGRQVLGIIDDNYYGNTDEICGLPVLASEQQFTDSEFLDRYRSSYEFYVATNWSTDPGHRSDTEKRRRLIDLVYHYDLHCANIIDPSAEISRHASLGQGIFIGVQGYVEPNVVIKDFAQIKSSSREHEFLMWSDNCCRYLIVESTSYTV